MLVLMILMLMVLKMMSLIDNDDSDADVDDVHKIGLLVVTLMEMIISMLMKQGYVVADVGSGDYFDVHDVDDSNDNYGDCYDDDYDDDRCRSCSYY
jgi:hypothetical protein